jgi:hypothetical protein
MYVLHRKGLLLPLKIKVFMMKKSTKKREKPQKNGKEKKKICSYFIPRSMPVSAM